MINREKKKIEREREWSKKIRQTDRKRMRLTEREWSKDNKVRKRVINREGKIKD